MLHDIRYGLRGLGRTPAFTATAALTLGLGVGVLTAFFAIVDAVLLQPIVADHDRVVRIWKLDVERGAFLHPVTYEEFRAFRERTRTLTAVAAMQDGETAPVALTIDNEPTAATVAPVSADFFTIIHRGRPLYGRWLEATDEVRGEEMAAVVSARFWRRVAAADPTFVGRRLRLSGSDRTLRVVGIAPVDVGYPVRADVWVPIAAFFDGNSGRFNYEDRRLLLFTMIGRLAPGISADAARAELDAINRASEVRFENRDRVMPMVVEPVIDTVVRGTRQVLLFLFAAAGFVLIIAGVNVAALLLMRASRRRHELAIRAALGASHARLALDAIAESLLLGSLAAAAGMVFAYLALGTMRSLAPPDVPRIEQAVIDLRVLAFCAVAVLAWVVTLGLLPSLAHRSIPAVNAGELRSRSRPRTAGLRLFTVAQIGAAVVVAIGAGLLVQSFVQLQRIDRGFESANVVLLSLLVPESRYPDPRSRVLFHEHLLTRVQALPDVVAAAPVHMEPGSGSEGLSAPMIFEGQTPAEAATNPWANWEGITPSYFRTFGIPILQGRGFTDADRDGAAPVVIVSESVARRYWPGQDPLGKRLRLLSEFPWVTVVGVAADVRYRELTKDWLSVYFPASQFFFFAPGKLAVRARSAPETLVPAIRQILREQDPHAAITSVATMETLLAKELSRPRIAFTVTTLFAFMAVLLAAVGVYAVMAYEVAERRYELAVRFALGATPGRLFRAVAGQSLALGIAGTAIGVVAASLATRAVRSLLYGVDAADYRIFVTGAALLLAVVLAACALPARRAALADPQLLNPKS